MKIIDKHLLKEISINYVFSHLILILVFFIVKLADLIDKLLSGNIDFFSLVKLIILLLPSLNSFIFPIATLSSILFTFSYMSSNNEIIALKSAGVSPLRLIRIPVIFGFIIFFIAIFNNLIIVPYSTKKFFLEFREIAKNKIFNSLTEKTFNEIVPNLIFFPDKVNKKKHLIKNLFIYDNTQKKEQIITATSCNYFANNEKIIFNLNNGEIHIKGKNENYQILKFQEYKFYFNLKMLEKGINIKLKDKESSISYLKKKIKIAKSKGNLKRVRFLKMEIYKRYSLPFACIIFALLAIPFGLTNVKNAKSYSILILILNIFVYYTLIAISSNLVKKGDISPFIGAWLPNLIFIIITSLLLYLCEKEKWLF